MEGPRPAAQAPPPVHLLLRSLRQVSALSCAGADRRAVRRAASQDLAVALLPLWTPQLEASP
ncbi:hypothetical protein U0070_002738 [Myodes glareolus]|uniref:Uncharacterized protein n=1 Tax=Myodes glareolus TaxID=447135 RepID=A0AAW0GWQ2_MYOGA